jgi:hypothetical protein
MDGNVHGGLGRKTEACGGSKADQEYVIGVDPLTGRLGR